LFNAPFSTVSFSADGARSFEAWGSAPGISSAKGGSAESAIQLFWMTRSLKRAFGAGWTENFEVLGPCPRLELISRGWRCRSRGAQREPALTEIAASDLIAFHLTKELHEKTDCIWTDRIVCHVDGRIRVAG
jgi:hypothetical protein